VYLEYCTGGRALSQVKWDEVGGGEEKNPEYERSKKNMVHM
jgi:hypothetical protein